MSGLIRGIPSPPVIAGTFSGFIVGVFVTLIATGVISHTGGSASPAATPVPPVAVADPQMYQRVKSIAVKQLGPSASTSKVPRLVWLTLAPSPPVRPSPPASEGFPQYRSVILQFRLYDHPLGRVWRLKAAKADVFAVMKALYSTSLPIYNIRMVGTFPLKSGPSTREQPALIAEIDHPVADKIPWRRWTRKQEGTLWNLLSFKHVDSRFA